MSNTNKTQHRSEENNDCGLNHPKTSRDLSPGPAPDPEVQWNDDDLAVFASLEWFNYEASIRGHLAAVGILDAQAYVDVRVGMKHLSALEFMLWAPMVAIGYANSLSELENYFDAQIQRLSILARWEKHHKGIDILAEARAATRHKRISDQILSHDLPSGAKYYYSPYDVNSNEYMVWLVNYSRRFERPWLGMPFGDLAL